MPTLSEQDAQEYVNAVQLFVFPALLTIAHNSGSQLFLRDSDYEYGENGEVVAVKIPPDLHELALVVAQDMYRFSQN